jgi:hypothetical protein
MEFQFDLAWREQLAGDATAEALADTLVTEPVLVLNPSLPENPLLLDPLYRPCGYLGAYNLAQGTARNRPFAY